MSPDAPAPRPDPNQPDLLPGDAHAPLPPDRQTIPHPAGQPRDKSGPRSES